MYALNWGNPRIWRLRGLTPRIVAHRGHRLIHARNSGIHMRLISLAVRSGAGAASGNHQYAERRRGEYAGARGDAPSAAWRERRGCRVVCSVEGGFADQQRVSSLAGVFKEDHVNE
jgi:hypothetical protein